jgi:hypothetical protein
VNTSATKNGWDRKRWILRARETSELVVFGQLVHTEDRDDVLQFLVTLQNVLNAASTVVVLLADDQRIQLTAGGVQRINGRVDTQGSDVTGQYDGGVQGGRRWSPGLGSVRSSAGTYTAWIEVIEPVLVEVMRSCRTPISSASVG